jgi:2-keto-4-pentenoate hydratase/2-oxohepta-3-ene-1,7-dioic acid hydratase in catechol pathway
VESASVNKSFYGRFVKDDIEFGGIVIGDKVYETCCDGLGDVHNLSDLTWLPPSEPSKLVCIGLNNAGHAKDVGRPVPTEPLLFLKAGSALAAHEEPVVYPSITKTVGSEAELVIVMGKTAVNVREDEALDYVLGYTCGNDLAARDIQRNDGQWMRGKSMPGFAPIGPVIRLGDIDPDNLRVIGRVNGKVYQDFNTSELVFGCKKLISYISQMMPLYPGDIIMTGTAMGSPAVNVGDVVEIEIEGIGILRNTMVKPE